MKTNSRWISLLVLCTGFLLIVVDMTIVNVALPTIGRDLRFTPSGLAWVINGYLVAFAGLLLLAGRLADLVGSKRVFLLGLGIFTAASLACGLSTSQPVLIGARFIQGVGGAASSAVILAMIVGLFPEPEEQAKAFGVFSFVASAGAAVGLLAGGVITQVVSWHWIFFVNVPIGIGTAVLGYRLLPARAGQLVVMAGLLAVAFGPERAAYARDLLVPMALLGLGGGLCFPALTLIAMSEAPPADSGLASGLLNTTGQVGGALGLAVMATVAAARSTALRGTGTPDLSALAGGYHAAWLVSAAIVLVTLAITVATLRPRATVALAPAVYEEEEAAA